MNMKQWLALLILVIFISYSVFSFSNQNPVYRQELNLSEIEKRIIETEIAYEKWEEKTDEEVTSNILHQETVKMIIVHHTAFEEDGTWSVWLWIAYEAISRNHKKRWEKWWINLNDAVTPDWKYMMYHNLIWADWIVTWSRQRDKIWWGTRNNNINVIHIALIGNFNNHSPSKEQYDSLNKIIQSIRDKYWWVPVYWHWELEGEATACPWKMFDYNQIPLRTQQTTNPKQTVESKQEWLTFLLSRYYSPMMWQKRYYNNKTYEQDVTMNCWASAIWNDWCLYPANWMLLTNNHRWKVVACPPKFKLWTKFNLDGIWVVECVDRWWAIQMQGNVIRLDMRCWFWDEALDNWNSCPTWRMGWSLVM